ncbi:MULTISPECIES: class I SAM-dependent methyltransferase [Arthrobacter]|uniref:Class I SAM-dependent methyltransferase n=2 Tax=Arthrobacter TaxID=1663 RepID=A0ABU9KHE9_9MICC|nr:class I SAM-dependent methyltransferase [Arthrobacter sp. YJM1]MDP5226683.1 class I SAM-dependent methyltransferase [Arthrobacter sp. YJM1]
MVQKSERLQLPGRGSGRAVRPVGNVTRGTTNPNRMRRVDRWVTGSQAWRFRHLPEPLAVDLGYGASPRTAIELFERLRTVNPGFRLTGLEIEPGRVARAREEARPGLDFRLGGFELPVSHAPVLVRAFNVLRQYDEADVPGIWATLTSRLAADGLLVEGTCDELGRTAAWVALDGGGPLSLHLSVNFGALEQPSQLAERLPKALIHRNVPGERIHAFLAAADQAWLAAAPLASFGVRQRWMAMCRALRSSGWPVLDGPRRYRLGELSVAWDAVAPDGVARRDHQLL